MTGDAIESSRDQVETREVFVDMTEQTSINAPRTMINDSTQSVRLDAGYLSFFDACNDATGLSQDIDWLFGNGSWEPPVWSPAGSRMSQGYEAVALGGETVHSIPQVKVLSALMSLPADVLSSSFFDKASLEWFMDSYWQNYNPHFSLLHGPTFSVQDAPPLLLVALLTLGATLSPDKEHYRVAEKIHEKLLINFSSAGSSVGGAGAISGSVLREDVFDPEDKGDRSSIKNRWYRWVEQELSYRAAYFAFVMDAQHSSIFGHSAALSLTDIHLPLPCADALWEGPTAAIWNRERARTPPTPFFLPALRALLARQPVPHTYSPFARFVLLHGLLCMTRYMITRDQTASYLSDQHQASETDGQDAGPSSTTSELDGWKDRLDRAIDTWSFSLLSRKPSLCLEAARPLQRIAHVNIHASLVDFHVLAGAPKLSTGDCVSSNNVQFDRAYERIKTWAHGRNAKRTLSHCLLLIQETMLHGQDT
ncbi:fungal-specific transcription factor domain-containing protein [Aspergillus filifer]